MPSCCQACRILQMAPQVTRRGTGGAPLVDGWSPSACMARVARCMDAWLWLATISSARPPATSPSTRSTHLPHIASVCSTCHHCPH